MSAKLGFGRKCIGDPPDEKEPKVSNSAFSDGLAMLLKDAEEKHHCFDYALKGKEMEEEAREYYKGSRDAYAYMILAIREAMNG
jgi:hypothetical protein